MAMFNKTLAHQKYPNIPMTILSAMERYIEHGIQPGGFLSNVLSNNLFEAFNCADKESEAALGNIVRVIFNDFPMIAHGSKEKMSDWMAQGGMVAYEGLK